MDATDPSKEPRLSAGPKPILSVRDRWVARLATSFVVVGVVLAWQAMKTFEAGATAWPAAVELFGAAAAFAMGVLGVRIRHRQTADPAK